MKTLPISSSKTENIRKVVIKKDRVRFINKEKDSKYGVLLVFETKGEYAIVGKGDFSSLGQNLMTINMNELKKVKNKKQ